MRKHKSPVKAAKQAEKRHVRNTSYKSAIHTITKKLLALSAAGDKVKAAEELLKAQSFIDAATTKKVLHKKTAARRVSRLARAVGKMGK